MSLPSAVIYIVDDDPSVREGAELSLQSLGMETRCFADVTSFLEAVDASRGGCLLLDVRLPDTSGLALQAELAHRNITLPVIMMSGKADVATAVTAMRQGAIDFLEKPFSTTQLLDRVQEGLRLSRERADADKLSQHAQQRLARLTPRERDVMSALIQGMRNKQAAAALNLSVRTIEVHRANLLDKLGVRTLPDLVLLAGQAGWDLDDSAS